MSKPTVLSCLRVTLLTLAPLIIFYALLFLWIDRETATFISTQILSNSPVSIICSNIAGIVSPGNLLVLSVLFLILGLGIKRIQFLKRVGTAGMLAFIIAGIIKVLLARYRPIDFLEHQQYGFHFLSTQHDLNSTPSGHMTMICALLGMLGCQLKNKVVWIVLILICVLLGISRILINAHFVSDVVLGAYIGFLSVYWVRSLYA